MAKQRILKMAVHDFVIDNQNGVNVRSDLNKALMALVTNSSSSTEPPNTYAFMFWADTGNNLLKQRNSSDAGWNTIKPLDSDTFDVDVELVANRSVISDRDFGINLI